MRVFHSDDPAMELDACKACGSVWFDSQEFEVVPEGGVESVYELQMRGAEALATYRLEQLRKSGNSIGDEPEESWKWIPAIFGFPVESETQPLRRYPLFTWALGICILVISILAFLDLETTVAKFGFVPNEAWRYGGLTLLSSFFLHGGILHLVGNLYFLLIFGDNVEDFLGRVRYAMLMLAATVVGDVVHLLANPASSTPCVGASGGISGAIVFYALQFPKARLGFVFRYFYRFRWVQIPAWAALVVWVVFQVIGIFEQMLGINNVAATAHLGGAGVGFLFWIWWRHQEHQFDVLARKD